ncbi:hypothetical protein EON66_10920, partial [archaeon]
MLRRGSSSAEAGARRPARTSASQPRTGAGAGTTLAVVSDDRPPAPRKMGPPPRRAASTTRTVALTLPDANAYAEDQARMQQQQALLAQIEARQAQRARAAGFVTLLSPAAAASSASAATITVASRLDTVTGVSGVDRGLLAFSASTDELLHVCDNYIVASRVMKPEGSTMQLPAVSAQRLYLPVHESSICAMEVSTDGRLIATASRDASASVILWSAAHQTVLAVLGPSALGKLSVVSGGLAFSADCTHLAVAGKGARGNYVIFVFDIAHLYDYEMGAPLVLPASLASADTSMPNLADRSAAAMHTDALHKVMAELSMGDTPPPAESAPATVSSLPLHTLPMVAHQVSDFAITRIRFSPAERGRLMSVGHENIRFWRVSRSHLPGTSIVLNDYARGVEFT